MKRVVVTLVLILVALSGATFSPSASAQDILLEGPLAGAPAVRKLVQYREMRFSVGPQFAYTINNDYMHNFLLGAKLEFNIFEWLAIGAVGYYGLNAPTKLTKHIANSQNVNEEMTTPAQSNFPSYTGAANFKDQVALLKGIYLGQVSFVPFRGKMSMFEKLFLAIDGAIFLGGGVVNFQERKSCIFAEDDTNECGTPEAPVVEREPKWRGTFTLGVAFMAYLNDWFALNLEWRMAPFKWNAGGTDEAGGAASEWVLNNDRWENRPSNREGDYPNKVIDDQDRTWNLNMNIALGFIFYLPTKPSLSN